MTQQVAEASTASSLPDKEPQHVQAQPSPQNVSTAMHSNSPTGPARQDKTRRTNHEENIADLSVGYLARQAHHNVRQIHHESPMRPQLSPSAQSDSMVMMQNTRSRHEMHNFASPQSLNMGAYAVARTPATPGPSPQASVGQPDPLHGLPDSCNEDSYLRLQEACLLRHFVDNLAPWVSGWRHVS